MAISVTVTVNLNHTDIQIFPKQTSRLSQYHWAVRSDTATAKFRASPVAHCELIIAVGKPPTLWPYYFRYHTQRWHRKSQTPRFVHLNFNGVYTHNTTNISVWYRSRQIIKISRMTKIYQNLAPTRHNYQQPSFTTVVSCLVAYAHRRPWLMALAHRGSVPRRD